MATTKSSAFSHSASRSAALQLQKRIPITGLSGQQAQIVRELIHEVYTDLIRVKASPAGFLSVKKNMRLSRAVARTIRRSAMRYSSDFNKYDLELGKLFFVKEDRMLWRDVIAHEMVHTIEGCFNHSDLFCMYLAKLERLGKGYNLSTRLDFTDYGISEEELPGHGEQSYKYMLECVECGYQYKRKRMSKIIENPDLARCGVCGGKLVRVR